MGSRAHVQAKITDDEVICVKNGLPLGMGPIYPSKTPVFDDFWLFFDGFGPLLDRILQVGPKTPQKVAKKVPRTPIL